MAIRSVVTRGFGPGATIPLVVTAGYAVGAVGLPSPRVLKAKRDTRVFLARRQRRRR